MIRSAVARALQLGLTLGLVHVGPLAAATTQAAITWDAPDDRAKTITVHVRIQIYSGCSGNPFGGPEEKAQACSGPGSQVSQFLADKIKSQIESVWKGHHYRCYELIFDVDVKLAPDRAHVDADRFGVRIDPSPVAIRSYVSAAFETTWAEPDQKTQFTTNSGFNYSLHTYAHEFGHLLGLNDTYHDVTTIDPKTGKSVTTSVVNPGEPADLMSTAQRNISQVTIDRLVEKHSPIDRSKLKCGWIYKDATSLGTIEGKQCEGPGGDWTIQGEQTVASGPFSVTTTKLWNVTIDEKTLKGTYTYEALESGGPTTTHSNSHGAAFVVLSDDGSAQMTLLDAKISATTQLGAIRTTTTLGTQGWDYDWKLATEKDCPPAK
jgi:hypothetical protein